MTETDPQPQYLTTREVAALLRVKERKVYDLAAAGDIPHRRLTGKLLFPREEIHVWIEGGTIGAPAAERPAVLAGSHDPLLDWAVRESGSRLATLFDGSTDGLDRFEQRQATLCGMHLPEGGDWNVAAVSSRALTNCVLVNWARRQQGLILPADDTTSKVFEDVRGKRVAMRQEGAGARAVFDQLAGQAGMTLADFATPSGIARTETEAATAVATGEADAAIGLHAAAAQFKLRFVPLVEEVFDLLVDRRSYFLEPVQTLLTFARGNAIGEKARSLGGYDLSDLGKVRWVSS